MRLSSLDGLVPFLAVAETRSFTAAASRLRVTRSAISQAVKALEATLGVTLFARTTRDVALTAEGVVFYAQVQPAVRSLLAAQEAASAMAGRPSGVVRITAPRLAAQALLAPRLPGFLATYPAITVEVFCDDRFSNIVEQGFDAGVRLGESIDKDMVAVRLSPPDRLIVIGSPAYFRAHGHPRHPRDLAAHRCINFRQSARGDLYRWEFTDGGEDFSVSVEGGLIVNDTELKLRAAMSGIGLACELESIARPHIAAGTVVPTLTGFAPSTPGFYVYFPHRAQVSPKLRAFIDYMTGADPAFSSETESSCDQKTR